MSPRVSVVMPVFNGAAFLAPALNSLRSQTLRAIEIIVVDDGSTDDSVALVESQAREDPRIVLIRSSRVRISAALNRGIAQARGAFIARMDADDIAHPQRLARQAEFLEAHPAVAVVGTGFRVIDATGAVLKTQHPVGDPKAVREALRRGNCLAHPTVMMRREAAALGYRELFPYAEDYDLWTRAAERWDLANLDEALLDYRDAHRPFDPVYFEQQIASTVAVAAMARRRAAGQAETLTTPATRASLAALGLERDLRGALRRAAFGRARLYALARRRADQRAALRFAARHAPRGEGMGAWLGFAARAVRARIALVLSR